MLANLKILIFLLIIFPTEISAQKSNELFLRANASIYEGNYNDAIISLSKISNINNKTEYLIARSKIYLQQKEYNKAIKDCENANKLKHNSANYLLAKISMEQKNYLATNIYLNKYIVNTKHISLFKLIIDSSFTKIHFTERLETLFLLKLNKK
nr:hypothetical protein [Bacteroidales bacterium]